MLHNNPNECTIPATWFVSKVKTDPLLVRDIFLDGYEVAAHTLTQPQQTTHWEVIGSREFLVKNCGLPPRAVNGFRTPRLAHSAQVRKSVHQSNFRYDSSIVEVYGSQNINSPSENRRLWPYTMDTRIVQSCDVLPEGSCQPLENYPGLWEVPVWMVQGQYGDQISVYDPPTKEESAFEIYKREFNRSYVGNRAPVGIWLHASYFLDAEEGRAREADMHRFFEFALSHPDVYVVTVNQLLDYLTQPVPIAEFAAAFTRDTQCPQGGYLPREWGKEQFGTEDDALAPLPQCGSSCKLCQAIVGNVQGASDEQCGGCPADKWPCSGSNPRQACFCAESVNPASVLIGNVFQYAAAGVVAVFLLLCLRKRVRSSSAKLLRRCAGAGDGSAAEEERADEEARGEGGGRREEERGASGAGASRSGSQESLLRQRGEGGEAHNLQRRSERLSQASAESFATADIVRSRKHSRDPSPENPPPCRTPTPEKPRSNRTPTPEKPRSLRTAAGVASGRAVAKEEEEGGAVGRQARRRAERKSEERKSEERKSEERKSEERKSEERKSEERKSEERKSEGAPQEDAGEGEAGARVVRFWERESNALRERGALTISVGPGAKVQPAMPGGGHAQEAAAAEGEESLGGAGGRHRGEGGGEGSGWPLRMEGGGVMESASSEVEQALRGSGEPGRGDKVSGSADASSHNDDDDDDDNNNNNNKNNNNNNNNNPC